MKKGLVLIAAASLMLSCSENPPIQELEKIPINISVGLQTRANDSAFENEDEIGLYVVNYDGETAGTLKSEGNQVDNVQFTYDGSGWNSTEEIYWKDQSTSADFYAYYPYSASVTSVTEHAFGVQADQSVEDNFWASDFLWGKSAKVSPTPMAVPIRTNHVFSRIVLEIKPGNGFTDDAWEAATKSVSIQEVKTSATIDLSTGVATATGSAGSVIPFAYSASGTTVTYRAMIVPQVVADNSKLVVVTIDGVDYVYRKGFTFNANTEHKFTVTVNKTEGSVDMSIGEWIIDDTTNEGDAVEENEGSVPSNQIWYVSTDGNAVTPSKETGFGANIESNVYENGKGIITFDSDVTAISGYAFEDCTNISRMTLPESIVSIGDYAFSGCSGLHNISIPHSVTTIGVHVFDDCTGEITVNCSIPSPSYSGETYGVFTYSKFTKVIIGEEATFIGNNAFRGCSSIQNITIGKNIREIGKYAFYNCTGELTVNCNIPKASEVANGAFYGSKFTSITLGDNVTSIGDYAFRNCNALSIVYCKPTTPPQAYSYMFSGNELFNDNAKIYVPTGTGDAYKIATHWKDYASIIEEKTM